MARRLALVNSVIFKVMRHRGLHVLHPLKKHIFSAGPCLPFLVCVFVFGALSALSRLRQSPLGDPTHSQPIAFWPCRASERDFSARPRPAVFQGSKTFVAESNRCRFGLMASSLFMPSTTKKSGYVWLLFHSSDLNRGMFPIAHIAIVFALRLAQHRIAKKD